MSSRPAIPDRVLTVVAGSCVALFGFLPVANWIPGGRSWPEYGTTVQHWLAGSAIAFGVAALARAVLLPLAAESLHVVRSPFSADSTERVLPGTVYGARCVQRVQEDRAGFTVYLPLTVIDGDDVIYARDLHARDSLLLARHPARTVYLLRPSSDHADAVPRFWRVSRDSLRETWRREESP